MHTHLTQINATEMKSFRRTAGNKSKSLQLKCYGHITRLPPGRLVEKAIETSKVDKEIDKLEEFWKSRKNIMREFKNLALNSRKWKK